MTPNQDEWRHIYSVTARITIQYHSLFSAFNNSYICNEQTHFILSHFFRVRWLRRRQRIEWHGVRDSIFDKMFLTFSVQSLSGSSISLTCLPHCTCIIWNDFQVYNEMNTHGTRPFATQNKWISRNEQWPIHGTYLCILYYTSSLALENQRRRPLMFFSTLCVSVYWGVNSKSEFPLFVTDWLS